MTTMQERPATTPYSQGPRAPSGTVARWMWTWITVGILVVLVVIGFLVAISNALRSIDAGLAEAATAVKSIEGDASPLPSYIARINENLTAIDNQLESIPSQAASIEDGLNAIANSLVAIDGSLQDTSASLNDTEASLVDTSNVLVNVTNTTGTIATSLVDTSNILQNVLGRATTIQNVLVATQRVDSQGTALIPINVARVNAILEPVQNDTSNIVARLGEVNANLTAICQSPVLRVLGGVTGTGC